MNVPRLIFVNVLVKLIKGSTERIIQVIVTTQKSAQIVCYVILLQP